MSSSSIPPDENKGPMLLGCTLFTTLIALFVVCARVYARTRIVKFLGADDYIIILSMCLSISCQGMVIGQVAHGGGRHAIYLAASEYQTLKKINFVSQPFFLWTVALVKVSIGLFLMRMAPARGYRVVLGAAVGFVVVYTFVCFLCLVLQCRDLAYMWDEEVRTTCFSVGTLQAISLVNSSLSIASDVFLAFIPIPLLWNVRINTRKKIGLVLAMGLGVFACAGCIVRVAYTSKYGALDDLSWQSTELALWFTVETNSGIVAASIPSLKPLFRRLFDGSSGRTPYGGEAYPMHSFEQRSKFKSGVQQQQPPPLPLGFTGTRITGHGHNNTSEEEILSPVDGITKTTVVSVDQVPS